MEYLKSLVIVFLLIFSSSARTQSLSWTDKDYLLVSMDYITNTNTFGLFVSEVKQPNFAPSVIFLSKHHFDISFSAYIVGNSDTSFSKTTCEYDFMAGYNFIIKDVLYIYPSYTHIEYSKNSYTLRSVFSDIAQLDLSAYLNWYNIGLTASYMHGIKDMFYMSFQNSIELNIDDLPFKNSQLSVQLGVDINFSDRNYYTEILYSDWDTQEFLFWIDSYNNPTASLRARQLIYRYGLDFTKERVYNIVDNWDPEIFGRDYNISSIDLFLPIYFSFNNLMINFSFIAVFPTYSNTFFESSPQMLFSTGLSYSFGL